MNRLKVFKQFNDVEACFTLKPEKTETLIPRLAKILPEGEYFIKPWMSEFISAKDETYWLIDLKEINRRFIELQGVEDIEVSPDCTCCLEDKYWSNRRSKDSGRMLAYIKIDQTEI